MPDRSSITAFVEVWGLVVAGSALLLEVALMVQRRLAERYGWSVWPTISVVFRDDGKVWLIFPFGWGLLPGHWWGPFPQLWAWDFWVWIATAAAVLARDVANRWHPVVLSKRWTFAALLLGVLEGALFWSTGT